METPSQQSTAFGVVPAVPVAAASTSVPGIAPPQAQTQDPNEKVKQILTAIMQASQRKQSANTAVPGNIPAQQDPHASQNVGMNTANPRAWGTQRMFGMIGANIKNAVAKQKQDQLLKAEGDWTYLQSSLNELYEAQQSGDPQKVKAAQAKVDATLSDPKKLKNMAKALNQDWLNPEKTTVYGEALKKVAEQVKQKEAQEGKKQQAAQGIKDLFKKLINKQQQPQLSDEQRQAMGREIQSKAPTTQPVIDPKLVIEQEKAEAQQKEAEASLIRAQKANPEKYEFKTVDDPKNPGHQIIVAADKTDPSKPYIEVKSPTGETAKPGDKKYVDDGKLEIISGIPTGRVKKGGRWIGPNDPAYTKDDEAAVLLGLNAQGLSDKQKQRLQAIRGESYARSRAVYTFKNVVNKQTGEVSEVSAVDMARNPGLYSGASEQEKISMRDAVHEGLTVNFKALGDSMDKLPNGLDTETQATIKMALRSDDPGVLETLLVNKIKQNAPDEVLQYLTNIKMTQEDILTMRTVGGMGQGSDMMRHAIMAVVPGPGTSSVKEGKMQLAAAKRTMEALFSGRPQSKLGDGGEMETQTHEGHTYQRKKGSNDAWTLKP